MRHSSLLLALSSLYAASVSAASCVSSYATIATWLNDFKPAQTWCAAQHGTPTTTVVVTQTIRPQEKRHAFPNLDLHNKPRTYDDNAPHHYNLKRQSPSSRTQWYLSLMKQQSTNKWVQAVCACIVPHVTTTVTSRVTLKATSKTSTKTSTTTTKTSIWSSSSSSSTLRTSTLSTSSSSSTSSFLSSSTSSTPSLSAVSSLPSTSTSSSSSTSTPSSSSSTSTPSPSPASLSAASPPSTSSTEDNCTDGPYAGTGACQCSYNVLCGTSGNCGEADETVVTPVDSWQACEELCDDNSNCTAWVYSSATGLCTEITDLNCGPDSFQTVEDPDSVLGVYDGGVECGGVCLI